MFGVQDFVDNRDVSEAQARPSSSRRRRVLLIGWDSADWNLITPLMDAGQMPNLARLVERGVMGNIATLRPALSPILWTSIATGKCADKHGVLGFIEPAPDGQGVRPIASTSRKTKAIWNILSQSGLSTHVINWYASHPAEPINGVCVSQQFVEHLTPRREDWPLEPGSVHPAELRDTIAACRVHPTELSLADLRPLIPQIDQIDLARDGRPEQLARILASCASVQSVATAVLEAEPAWDFLAVYFDALDLAGHYFMQYHPPKMPGVSDEDSARYGQVMNGLYRFHDMTLGRLLKLAGEDATVMLVSDHGFYSDHLRPASGSGRHAALAAAWHRPQGIFCMSGPDVRAMSACTAPRCSTSRRPC